MELKRVNTRLMEWNVQGEWSLDEGTEVTVMLKKHHFLDFLAWLAQLTPLLSHSLPNPMGVELQVR